MWVLFYLLFLSMLGMCVGITVKKIQKDPYNPYYLRHVIIGYACAGALFLVGSLVLLFQI